MNVNVGVHVMVGVEVIVGVEVTNCVKVRVGVDVVARMLSVRVGVGVAVGLVNSLPTCITTTPRQ